MGGGRGSTQSTWGLCSTCVSHPCCQTRPTRGAASPGRQAPATGCRKPADPGGTGPLEQSNKPAVWRRGHEVAGAGLTRQSPASSTADHGVANLPAKTWLPGASRQCIAASGEKERPRRQRATEGCLAATILAAARASRGALWRRRGGGGGAGKT